MFGRSSLDTGPMGCLSASGLGALGDDDWSLPDFSSVVDSVTNAVTGGGSSGASCPPGTSQSPFDGSCVDTTQAPPQSPGALPKFGTCPAGMIDDPKNPASFCIIDPKVNTTCPKGQVFDLVTGKCGAPLNVGGPIQGSNGPNTSGLMCPYGQKVVNGKCQNVSGSTPTNPPAPKPNPATPKQPQPAGPAKSSFLSNPLVWGVALLAVGGAAVVIAKRKKAA